MKSMSVLREFKKYSFLRRMSTGVGPTPPTATRPQSAASAARDEQTRGAMRQFLEPASSESTDGLWMRLRNDLKKDQGKSSPTSVGGYKANVAFSNKRNPASRGNRKGVRRVKDKSDFKDEADEILNDYEGFDPIRHEIDTSGMDDIDALFARVYTDSYCSKNSDFVFMSKTPSFNRIRLPKARCISELAMATKPNIDRSVPVESDGYEFGVQAWETLAKNLYVPERDKEYMANRMAIVTNRILESAEKSFQENEEVDMIFDPSFRKGLAGVEAELLELARAEGREVTEIDFSEEETNWEVEAVVDEDQL